MSARWSEKDLANHKAKRGEPSKGINLAVGKPKPNKYSAIKTEVGGIIFDSRLEARRFQELKLLERAGKISDLRLQVSYPLIVNGVKIAVYRSDFEYLKNGQKVVEDTKSAYTRKLLWYGMKKKLMLALHGIEIKES